LLIFSFTLDINAVILDQSATPTALYTLTRFFGALLSCSKLCIILHLGKIRPRFGLHAKQNPPPTSPESPRERSSQVLRGPRPTMLGRLRLLSGEIPEPHTLMFIYLLLHLVLDFAPSSPPPIAYYGLSRGAFNAFIKSSGCWICCSLLIRARILEPKLISR
jgi:hypothetical protein